ncbi:MAG: hypothetical protein ACO3EZ_05250, partial [Prochlorotrichaceae cyanobacterium]
MTDDLSLELEAHCRQILRDRRIKSRVIILCEGGTDQRGRLSPQSYRRNDRLPDSNFYQACVPTWWKRSGKPLPKFINSGDRSKVIATYFGLLHLHHRNPSHSYLTPGSLFALVDLDLQTKKIDHYAYSDLESIFHALYQNGQFRVEASQENHHLFVTGLVHKEAYYLLPEIRSIFEQYQIRLNGQNLELDELYLTIAEAADTDQDLKMHFHKVRARLSCDRYFQCQTLAKFQESWMEAFETALTQPSHHKRLLVHNLLTVCKAKRYWKQIHPAREDTRSSHELQDQLIPFIGRVYAEQPVYEQHQIPSLF